LEANNFDYALLAGVGIVDECILDTILIATLNAHPAPLPECRGGGALEQTLYKKLVPAVSVHIVTPGIDEGDILEVENLSLDKNDSFDSVYFRLGLLCGEVLVRVLEKVLVEGEYRRSPNNGKLNYWIDANEQLQKTARLTLKALLRHPSHKAYV
jgi:methionyl-tRNA formyltransferase